MSSSRFGHSMVPSNFRSVSRQRSETLQMSQQFFSPDELKSPGFLDGLVRGMTKQGGQLWDNKFVEDLRNHLFESRPGRGGLDLVAVNIQRGRDHGLPGYNMYREICTGSRAKDWADLRLALYVTSFELYSNHFLLMLESPWSPGTSRS